VTGLSIFWRAVLLVMVCVSCQGAAAPQEEVTTSSSQLVIKPAERVFLSAIAVRDQGTAALIGRLAKGQLLPAQLKIAFHDDSGALLDTISVVTVQGAGSGLVYAAPAAPLTDAQQAAAIAASSARVIVGSVTQSVYLGQAEGTISMFNEGYWPPAADGYGGCPHCLQYFLCHCLPELEGVTLSQPPLVCLLLDLLFDEDPNCETPEELEPVPW
jgi:hypothetical protein